MVDGVYKEVRQNVNYDNGYTAGAGTRSLFSST
jgi:hypothetical protein